MIILKFILLYLQDLLSPVFHENWDRFLVTVQLLEGNDYIPLLYPKNKTLVKEKTNW